MPNFSSRLKIAFDALPNEKDRVKSNLAKHCKVSKASVSDWFSKETKSPSAEALLLACEYLKVSPWWLMLGKGTRDDKNISIQYSTWPFESIPQERFDALTERQKGRVEQKLVDVMNEVEAQDSKAKTA